MSHTTVAVITNDFKVKNPKLVKEVLEQLGFKVSIAEDESIVATAEEDNIDDTTHVVVDHEEIQVYGEIKIDTFRNNFSEYDNLMFHLGDNTGNYFGTYETSTGRMCNRVAYYVDLIKLANYLTR